MNTQQIIGMLDEMYAAGMIKIGITGGEPMLRNDIGKIIDYAHGLGIISTMNSNGTLIPERINYLRNLHTLFISIDGSKEIHEKTRGPKSFWTALKAIEAANESGINVWTLTVLTKHNIRELDNLIRVLSEYKVKMLFQPVEKWDIHSNNINDLLPEKVDYLKAVKRLIEMKDYGKLIGASMSYLKLLEKWPNYPINVKCAVGNYSCNILPDGEVIACTIAKGMGSNNGVKKGFINAFMNLHTPYCNGCFMNCYHEPNFICRLKPDALLNAIRFNNRRR